jgi:7-cyano-7-deazaguanine synthase
VSEKRAVVLLSGGLDSATTLAIARTQGFDSYCLSFEYGQRHNTEVKFAKKVASHLGAQEFRVARIDIGAFGGSALTDMDIDVPVATRATKTQADASQDEIPITYVPARNTIFLSYALGWAEVLGASDIFIGVNAVDYSGYPDCRPEFISAFETMANLATRVGIEGARITIRTPLIDLRKEEIIKLGMSLGVDYSITVSCYQLDSKGISCGVCESCQIRKAGFAKAGTQDPTRYS